jgi:hypothetical protein
MPERRITQKTETALTVSENAKRLFQVIFQEQSDSKTTENDLPKIKVSDLISKMSFYYEKIRNIVDYKEEHLLRKNAIERILRRQIIIEGVIKESKSDDISKHLLTELIRAAYLPNNKILKNKIDELSLVIAKYIALKNYISNSFRNETKIKNSLIKWIIALAASDIEERLGGSKVDQTVINNMYEILRDSIQLPEGSPFREEKDLQIYLGIYRSYLKYDREMLAFIVFKHYYPDWQKGGNEEINRIGRQFTAIKEEIDKQIDHPLARQFNRVISRYTVFYTILTDVIDDDPAGVYKDIQKDPKSFPRLVKRKCEERYRVVKKKLWRSAIRSIVYIFITKSLFAIILEVPAIKWFGDEVNPLSLIINVGFPAVLLFLIVFFTRLPTDDNSRKIVEGIEEIVFVEHKRQEPYQLRTPIERSAIKNSVFGLIYTVTFFLSFGIIVWALGKIQFNVISITIFLFFLALVSFFSIRIRKSTKELIILEPKENILSLFSDFFYTPIVAVGKWLSEKFSRINVFVFVLDFIIEAPFKIFVEVAEEWTRYVRERKEEIM